MNILISGGAKNGKSTLAQMLGVAQGSRHVYVATMRPRDTEDEARVVRHRAEREGWGFDTVECSAKIEQLAGQFPRDTSMLLDSTTALLAEEMFQQGGVDMDAPSRVRDGLLTLMDAYDSIVFVSDAIYSDAIRYDTVTEAYRKGLADIDRALAAHCGAVIEMVYGQKILHKGDERIAAWLEEAFPGADAGAGPVHCPAGIRPLG